MASSCGRTRWTGVRALWRGFADDSALSSWSAELAARRHFDRNSWFNQNGTGSNITRFDNALLALDIFRFLASVPATTTPVGSGCGRTSVPVLAPDLPVLGRSQRYVASGASPNAPGLLLLGVGPAFPTPFPGGCVTQVSPALFASRPATTPTALAPRAALPEAICSRRRRDGTGPVLVSGGRCSAPAS